MGDGKTRGVLVIGLSVIGYSPHHGESVKKQTRRIRPLADQLTVIGYQF
jgi:hypothetical protein